MNNSIKTLTNGKVKANILCIAGKEGNLFVAVAPSLKLTSNSKTSVEDAKKNLKVAMRWFFDHYNTKSLLNKELKRLGWNNDKDPQTAIMPIAPLDQTLESYKESILS